LDLRVNDDRISLSLGELSLKCAMYKNLEYILIEMQYDMHNYVFSGV